MNSCVCLVMFYPVCKLFDSISVFGILKIFADYQPMVELVWSLVQKFILPYSNGESKGFVCVAADRTFQLMLCVLDGIHSNNNLTVIRKISLQWAPVFQLRSSRYLT